MTNIFNKDDIKMLIRQSVEGPQDLMFMTALHKNGKKLVDLAERFSQLRVSLFNVLHALEALPENELIAYRANYE